LKKQLTIWLICFLCGSILSAQGLKSWSVEPTLRLGRIIKHTPKLTFDINEFSYGADVNFLYQTHGRKEWNQLQRYPLLGIALTYFRMGEPDIIGSAYGILPNINIPIRSPKNWKFYFQMGTGIAYLTQEFSEINNPTYNAIGSHVNTIAKFEFTASHRLNNLWVLNAGLSMTHYSNGGSHLPNFGLNIPALSFGARYEPKPVLRKDFVDHGITKDAVKKFGFTAHFALGYRERIVSGGPSYPVYVGSVGALYYLNRVNRLIGGVEYEFNEGAYAFGTHVGEFESEKEARQESSRIMVYVADEFLFGNWSVTVLAGAYTGSFYQVGFPIYNKLITRYYFPPIADKVQMHVGLYLKSHIVIAEYIGIGVGFAM